MLIDIIVTVLSGNLEPPPFENSTIAYYGKEDEIETIDIKNHDYTDCCRARMVSQNCLGFCNIQSILDGTTGEDPEKCEPDFKEIVKCMAGQRIKSIILLQYIISYSIMHYLFLVFLLTSSTILNLYGWIFPLLLLTEY